MKFSLIRTSIIHRAALLAFAVQLFALDAIAQEFLDQSHGPLAGWGSPSNGLYAQTFTVGKAGSLARVEVALRPFYIDRDPNDTVDVGLSLVRAPAGIPSPLAVDLIQQSVVSLPNASLEPVPQGQYFIKYFQWVKLDLPPLPVQVGDQFAIVASHQGAIQDPFDWGSTFDATANYAGGAAWFGFNGIGSLITYADYYNDEDYLVDLVFRTYVVPEPSSFTFIAIGIVAYAGCRRRAR